MENRGKITLYFTLKLTLFMEVLVWCVDKWQGLAPRQLPVATVLSRLGQRIQF